ncbi:MAG: heat-inducible transcriptional repressor HrcA [Pseudomonadota bacterium]
MVVANERASKVLRVLIENYLENGMPVSSSAIVKSAGLGVSASTVRNVLSELESLGLVMSPHTSAGRIPTALGYRFFVDNILQVKPIIGAEMRRIQHVVERAKGNNELLDNTTQALSKLTSMCSLVGLPRKNEVVIERVQFVPIAETRVLVIFVLSNGEIQNRLLNIENAQQLKQLDRASAFINEHFSGLTPAQTRQHLLRLLNEDRAKIDGAMRSAIDVADQALMANHDEGNIVVSGQSHLFDIEWQGDMDKLRAIFDAFTEKRSFLNLLDRCLAADQFQLFIGEESGFDELQNCSIVAAPYEINGKRVGVLAVIGPTRMDYRRVIPLVDITAKMLTSTLNP